MVFEISVVWVDNAPAEMSRRIMIADQALDEFEPLLHAIIDQVIVPGVEQTFARGGRPRWTPLAASTIARKARGFDRAANPRAKLVHSGALRAVAEDSLSYFVEGNDTIRSDLEDVPYWRFHQEGTGVPQRIILKLTRGDQDKMGRMLLQHVAEIMETSLRGARRFVRR